MRVTDPALVGTYAFVNPVVAVAMGCTIGNESLGAATVAAGVLNVFAVILIHTSAFRANARRRPSAAPDRRGNG